MFRWFKIYILSIVLLSSCAGLQRDTASVGEKRDRRDLEPQVFVRKQLGETEFKSGLRALVKRGSEIVPFLLERIEGANGLERARIVLVLDRLDEISSLKKICDASEEDEDVLKICMSALSRRSDPQSDVLAEKLHKQLGICGVVDAGKIRFLHPKTRAKGPPGEKCPPPTDEFSIVDRLSVNQFSQPGRSCEYRVPVSVFISDAVDIDMDKLKDDFAWASGNLMTQCVDVCFEVKNAYKIAVPDHLLDLDENAGVGDITDEEIEFLTFLHERHPDTLNMAVIQSTSMPTLGEAFYKRYPSRDNQRHLPLMHSVFLIRRVFDQRRPPAYFTVLAHEYGHVAFDKHHVTPLTYLMNVDISRQPPYSISGSSCENAIKFSQGKQ